MQMLSINCPHCGEKLEQLPSGEKLFEDEEHGFIYGCETLDCEGAIFQFRAIAEKDEHKYVLRCDS